MLCDEVDHLSLGEERLHVVDHRHLHHPPRVRRPEGRKRRVSRVSKMLSVTRVEMCVKRFVTHSVPM